VLSQETTIQNHEIQIWLIQRLVFYDRNPRKNDAAVDRMCASIREFRFKILVLVRSDGEVGVHLRHLRLMSAFFATIDPACAHKIPDTTRKCQNHIISRR
jgi:hypothetical protein